VLLSPAAQFGARRQRTRDLLRNPPKNDDGNDKSEPLHGGCGGDGDGGRGLSLEGRDGGGGVAVAVGGGGLAGY
jgi:hypothetical protein